MTGENPSDAAAAKGHSRERRLHDQAASRSARFELQLQGIYLIADMMETATLGDKTVQRRLIACRLYKFNGWRFRSPATEETDPGMLQRIMDDVSVPMCANRAREVLADLRN